MSLRIYICGISTKNHLNIFLQLLFQELFLEKVHFRRIRFAPKCNTSPGLAGPIGSSYEDYSVTKTRKKTCATWLQKSGGARTVHAYYSDGEICITCTLRCPSCTHTKWSILLYLYQYKIPKVFLLHYSTSNLTYHIVSEQSKARWLRTMANCLQILSTTDKHLIL